MKTVLLITVVSLCICDCIAQTQPSPTKQETLRGVEAVEAAQRGRFVLKGMVVDEEGKILDKVSLRISESRLKEMGTKNEGVDRSQEVNGEFTVEVNGADCVDIWFYRDGYYSEHLSFSTDEALPKNWDSRVMRGEKVDSAVVKRDGLRVVLEKYGKLADLTMFPASLRSSVDGDATVWNLAILSDGQGKDVKNVRDEASLPASCFYLDPQVDASGKLLVQQVLLGSTEQQCPGKVRVVMKGDGGFVPVLTVAQTNQRQYRKMKEAPVNGYQKELVLDADAIKRYFQSRDEAKPGTFFYVKIGKLYGKGKLAVNFARNNAVEATIVLHIQPDGSRNMEGER